LRYVEIVSGFILGKLKLILNSYIGARGRALACLKNHQRQKEELSVISVLINVKWGKVREDIVDCA
jgi:hypothetical protein